MGPPKRDGDDERIARIYQVLRDLNPEQEPVPLDRLRPVPKKTALPVRTASVKRKVR
jgi:hypothetical protein